MKLPLPKILLVLFLLLWSAASFYWYDYRIFAGLTILTSIAAVIFGIRNRVKPGLIEVLLLINLAYWAMSGLIAYFPFNIFVQPAFLRTDGRIFPVYMLFLALIYLFKSINVRLRQREVAVALLTPPTLVATYGLIQYFYPNFRILDAVVDVTNPVPGGSLKFFLGFHGAHNAAGVAYGAASLTASLAYLFTNRKIFLLPALALMLAFSLTYSKSSLISFVVALILIVALIWYKVRELHTAKRMLVYQIPMMLAVIAFSYLGIINLVHFTSAQQAQETTKKSTAPATTATSVATPPPSSQAPSTPAPTSSSTTVVKPASTQAFPAPATPAQTPTQTQTPTSITSPSLGEIGSGNVVIAVDPELPNNANRIDNLKKSLDLWQSSPLFGVGIGRYDDVNYQSRSIFGIVTQAEIVNSTAHAHNSYLQTVSELGTVGLILFLAFWAKVLQTLVQGWRKGIFVTTAAFAGVVVCLVSAGFEHTLVAPSAMTFSFILVALGLQVARGSEEFNQ